MDSGAVAAVPAEDSGCSNSPGLSSGEGPGGHPPSFFSKEKAAPADGEPPSPGHLQKVNKPYSPIHANIH